MSITIIPTAASAQSSRESILSLYGHEEYRHISWDPLDADIGVAYAASVDLDRASVLIENSLHIDSESQGQHQEEQMIDDYASNEDEGEDSHLEEQEIEDIPYTEAESEDSNLGEQTSAEHFDRFIYEIFKRQSNDPVEKVLASVLKKYNIHDDQCQYAFCIGFGDEAEDWMKRRCHW